MINNPPPVTRFAPSPTGFLHIGGVRTAIFNWLYARAKGGRFLVRIEDTDQERSTPQAVKAILEGLNWMGLASDLPVKFQTAHRERHIQIAQELLAAGRAYRCYCTAQELQEMRTRAIAEGLPRTYDGTWRDHDPSTAPADRPFVIRFKANHQGMSTINDGVQGKVSRPNETIDDLILLRADGSPTYNLSVVVDDHDMGVSHVIRGDDHLNNAFIQLQIYQALDWAVPTFAHIPLIHGQDGAKLSKRHGALGIEAYRDQGYSAEGLFAYLLKLGWSHGDEDIVPRARALEIFDLEGIGKSPSRLDLDKLKSVNKALQDQMPAHDLLRASLAFARQDLSDEEYLRLQRGTPAMAERAATYADMAAQFRFFLTDPPLTLDEKAAKALDADGKRVLAQILPVLEGLEDWSIESFQACVKAFAIEKELKMGKVFQPLRAALTGSMSSPGVGEIAFAFGQEKTLRHIRAAL